LNTGPPLGLDGSLLTKAVDGQRFAAEAGVFCWERFSDGHHRVKAEHLRATKTSHQSKNIPVVPPPREQNERNGLEHPGNSALPEGERAADSPLGYTEKGDGQRGGSKEMKNSKARAVSHEPFDGCKLSP